MRSAAWRHRRVLTVACPRLRTPDPIPPERHHGPRALLPYNPTGCQLHLAAHQDHRDTLFAGEYAVAAYCPVLPCGAKQWEDARRRHPGPLDVLLP